MFVFQVVERHKGKRMFNVVLWTLNEKLALDYCFTFGPEFSVTNIPLTSDDDLKQDIIQCCKSKGMQS